MEDSQFDVDGPPSSPFVSQIAEINSRATSKQHTDLSTLTEDEVDTLAKPLRTVFGDQENMPPSDYGESDGLSATNMRMKLHGVDIRVDRLAETQCMHNLDLRAPPTRNTPEATPVKLLSTTPAHGDSRSHSPHRRFHPTSADKTEANNVDETCFSTFSEVQDLTWTKPSQSPPRLGELANGQTPLRRTAVNSPLTRLKRLSPSRSPSPTSRGPKKSFLDTSGSSPTCLIDFTEQMDNIARPKGLASSRTEPNLLQHLQRQRSPAKNTRASLATPAKPNSILDLLDFELPPAPTPRSVPTITVRELETLKSQYLSQISSLNATLNGREAEVESFKKAIADAERRVGEAQEALREEKIRREQAEQEKLDWERRGMEVENVLKTVRDEILRTETEKEELVSRAEAGEKRADAAEKRAIKAEERLAAISSVQDNPQIVGDNRVTDEVQKLVMLQIDAKIEAVSRELHAVYKEKHERKVATLKQSYEARNQKRVAELQSKVVHLERANDELLVAKAALIPLPAAEDGQLVGLRTQVEEQKACVARVEQELSTSKKQQEELVAALEQERIEKGDLVAAVDEMLLLQAEQGPAHGPMSIVEEFRRSVSRPPPATGTGLRVPGESKIARVPQASRTPAGKSKMLANIERMGRATAAAAE